MRDKNKEQKEKGEKRKNLKKKEEGGGKNVSFSVSFMSSWRRLWRNVYNAHLAGSSKLLRLSLVSVTWPCHSNRKELFSVSSLSLLTAACSQKLSVLFSSLLSCLWTHCEGTQRRKMEDSSCMYVTFREKENCSTCHVCNSSQKETSSLLSLVCSMYVRTLSLLCEKHGRKKEKKEEELEKEGRKEGKAHGDRLSGMTTCLSCVRRLSQCLMWYIENVVCVEKACEGRRRRKEPCALWKAYSCVTLLVNMEKEEL